MTYLRRSFKYFVQLILLFIVLIGALMLAGMIPTDVALAFRKGWASVLYILALFAAMGAVYPLFGYGKRSIRVLGDPAERWEKIDRAMDLRGYVPAGDAPEGGRRYRLRSALGRATRLWEDVITLTPLPDGIQAEGQQRDLSRVISSLAAALSAE